MKRNQDKADAKPQDHVTLADPIEQFWKWFAQNRERIVVLYSGREFEILSQTISLEIDKIEKDLAWEIGPGLHRKYLLAISSEGDEHLRSIAQAIIRAAPQLGDWEFHTSKPARPPAGEISLPERNTRFRPASWRFVPIERPENGRLDLVILDEKLAATDRETALKAVSIYLDELLGEDTVEIWIGMLEVRSPAKTTTEKAYDITELPDYLHWVTHREHNRLRRTGHRHQAN